MISTWKLLRVEWTSIPEEIQIHQEKKVRDWVNFFKDEAKLKEFDQWNVIIISLELLYSKICEILQIAGNRNKHNEH